MSTQYCQTYKCMRTWHGLVFQHKHLCGQCFNAALNAAEEEVREAKEQRQANPNY